MNGASKVLCASLARELAEQFPFTPSSVEVLAAAMDPRFRSLSFDPSIDVAQVCGTIMEQATSTSQAEGVTTVEPSPKRSVSALDMLLGKDDELRDACMSSMVLEQAMQYFTEQPAPRSVAPLLCWKDSSSWYPLLTRLVKRLLCTPCTSVPAKRIFTCSGLIASKLRASLTQENVDMLVFLCKNTILFHTVKGGVPVKVISCCNPSAVTRLQYRPGGWGATSARYQPGERERLNRQHLHVFCVL